MLVAVAGTHDDLALAVRLAADASSVGEQVGVHDDQHDVAGDVLQAPRDEGDDECDFSSDLCLVGRVTFRVWPECARVPVLDEGVCACVDLGGLLELPDVDGHWDQVFLFLQQQRSVSEMSEQSLN